MTNELNNDILGKRARTTKKVRRQPATERRLGRDAIIARRSDSMAAESVSLKRLRGERVIVLPLGDDSEENRLAQQMYLDYGANAYSSYLRYGRGALIGPLINGRPIERLTRERYKELEPEMQVVYLPVTAEPYTTVPAFAPVKQYVESYDPENEIVSIVLPPGGTAFAFVLSKGDISPLELHEYYGDSL